ncbi:ArnT family glycosyltransferase [Basilea psittacipulmonis]|uniref:ArnT family glycosyltransferase n=1 Tax=Basilea psittacipulmonis TaxID=1472345 RepID=UPI00068D5E30|nr:glycosyltransferase family 39 protein [Basilea psittacipulmonis]
MPNRTNETIQHKFAFLFDFCHRLLNRGEKISSIWLIVGVFLWFFLYAWSRPFLIPDEGRYVGVAWEMIRSGNYLIPTLNDQPFFHKPPLMYWLTALFLNIFGHHEYAARLTPILGALIGIFSFYFLIKKHQHPRTALLYLIIASTLPLLFMGAEYANLDMLVAGLISACIVCFVHCALLINAQHPHQSWLIVAYGLAGLAFLAKGLIGIVLPAGAIGLWLVLTAQWRLMLPLLAAPWAWLTLLIIILPWLIAVQIQYPCFLHYFFIVQHFERYTDESFNNPNPAWFYLIYLVPCVLPYLYWLLKSLIQHPFKPSAQIRLMAWVAVLWMTLFFSIPNSKLIGYIFPVTFFLAYLIADAYYACKITAIKRLSYFAGVTFFATALIMTVIWLTFRSPKNYQPAALTLSSSIQANDEVYMLGYYYYSFPFYAGLKKPVYIIDHWNKEQVLNTDNWQRELMEGTVLFKPQDEYLYKDLSHLDLCQISTPSWIVSSPNRLTLLDIRAFSTIIHQDRNLILAKIDPDKINAVYGCKSSKP